MAESSAKSRKFVSVERELRTRRSAFRERNFYLAIIFLSAASLVVGSLSRCLRVSRRRELSPARFGHGATK